MEAIQATLEAQVAEQHRHHRATPFFYVWGTLLLLTAIEVYLAYQHLPPIRMLSLLMGLSILKAGLIIAYFMHMKYELSRMRWLTMASLVVCLCLMLFFLPDAFRLLSLGVSAR
ncbi:MAG: cytochrome C oxidase subunit IV family protein [Terriglobales bacterium]